MVVRFVLLLSLLLISATLSAKDLSARADRTQIGIGEQVQLVVTLSNVRGKRPDIALLQRDFSIDRQTESSNVQVINGVASYDTTWVYLLSPNRKGKLTIPALKVDQLSSDPIEITVTEMPVAQSTSDDVLIEVSLSPESPYVGSQVAYVQRLYYSRPLVDRASISKPKLAKGEADIEFWGASDPSYVTHNNRPYQLIERYYIIYPKKPGVLEFEPSVFNGSLASSRSRQRNDFRMNMFRAGTRVNAYSAIASIDIKAKPANYAFDHWLPASQLTLNMNLSQAPETLQAGEPLTVTIALMAEGLKAEVLPEVKLDLPANLKSYPEKPSFRTDKVANGMVGLRQEKIVLIANEAGEFVIPEVTIPWWSVTEDKQKFAKLDSVTLTVAGGVVSPLSLSNGLATKDSAAEEPDQSNELVGGHKSPVEPAEKKPEVLSEKEPLLNTFSSGLLLFYQQNRQWLLVAILGLTALFGFIWFGLRRRKLRTSSSSYQQKIAIADSVTLLESACKQNDPKAAIVALPKWAANVGIYPATMSGVEMAGDQQLSEAVKQLTAANYSPNPASWNGEALMAAVNQFAVSQQGIPVRGSGLSPLHPVAS